MATNKDQDLKPTLPDGFMIEDYFAFEQNIVYLIKDLPEGLHPLQYFGIRNKAFEKHLEHCDEKVRESWFDGTHPSLDWEAAEDADPIANDLLEILRPIGVEKVGIGFYHGNTIVLFPTFSESDFSLTKAQGKRLPWFYKGFMIR